MGSVVADIRANGMDIAATVLGAEWQEMRFVMDPLKNDERSAKQSYGIAPMEADTAETVTRDETLQHYFKFLIMNTVPRQDSDSQVLTTLEEMYDKLDQIFKLFVGTKMNMATSVVQVAERQMDPPTLVQEIVFIQMRFWVKYRQTVN